VFNNLLNEVNKKRGKVLRERAMLSIFTELLSKIQLLFKATASDGQIKFRCGLMQDLY